MKSLAVRGFSGCEPNGLQPPLLFCETPPAVDELPVEQHPALIEIAAQHSKSMLPRKQLVNQVTAQLHNSAEETENVAAKSRKKRSPRP
jgi:hypothetical protein